jgi:hypothetical protein
LLVGGTENGFAGACRQIAYDGRFYIDFALHEFSPFPETVTCPLFTHSVPQKVGAGGTAEIVVCP